MSNATIATRSWREIERHLVEYFRSYGVEIKKDGGDFFITAVAGALPGDDLDELEVSLSEIARVLGGLGEKRP
jgi:hypothetical protein